MNPTQTEIIRCSHACLMQHPGALADMFRVNLLRIDPGLHALVKTEGGHHDHQTVVWLASVVTLLGRPALMADAMHRLGQRLGPMLDDARIRAVARALLQTLQQALGDGWDAETCGAWTALCSQVSAAVVSGAAQSVPEAEAQFETA